MGSFCWRLSPVAALLLLVTHISLTHPPHLRSAQAYSAQPQAAFDCSSIDQIPAAECDALVSLYNATDGENWVSNDGWLTTTTPCEWYGVACNSEGHVHQIFLEDNQLVGPIPPELGDLTELTWLQLNSNQLNGPIPPELGKLTQVTWLRLEFNELTGSIPPELANMAELDSLYLADNQLTGPIPPELGNFPHLYKLNLSFTQLSGPIPPELANLSTLETLVVTGTALEGPLPSSFTSLENLFYFHFLDTAICTPKDAEVQAWLQNITDLYSPEIACIGAQESNPVEALPAISLPTEPELPAQEAEAEPPQLSETATEVAAPTQTITPTRDVAATATPSPTSSGSASNPNPESPSIVQLGLLALSLLLIMVGGVWYGWWMGQPRR